MLDSSHQGLEEIAQHVSAFRWSNLLGAVGILFGLFGLTILSGLLQDAGDRLLPQPALIAFLIASLLFLFGLAFHMSATVWAALETVQSSSVPEFYPPLRRWVETSQGITVALGFASVIGYDGSILRTGLLPGALGWACALSGLLWLVMSFAGSGVAVGLIVIMPTLMGVVLLLRK